MTIPIGANAENIVDFIAKLGRPLNQGRVYLQVQDFSLTDARIKEALAAHARGEQVVITTKVASVPNAITGSDDARQSRILKGLIAAGLTDLVWGIYHEPEDDVKNGTFTSTQWRAMQSHMLPLANAILHPVGGKTISILMSYTANPKSGRNVDDYRVPEADIQGWDIYEKAGSSSGDGSSWATKDPSTMPVDEKDASGKQIGLWGMCFDVSERWGKPTMVPEFGCLRRQADTLGVERGKYFNKVAACPRVAAVLGIMYYEVGPPRFNYAFRTEAAGIAGFKAIGAAGGVIVTPPGDCDECEAELAAALVKNTELAAQVSDLTTRLTDEFNLAEALQGKIDKAKADLS